MTDNTPPANDVRETLPFVVTPKGGEWQHCSPALISSGFDCGGTLRRSCLCPGGGSHDHYVEVRPRGTVTDPNTIPDDVADAAQIEWYEFAFGPDAVKPSDHRLGVSRQAWKCAIAVAIDKMKNK